MGGDLLVLDKVQTLPEKRQSSYEVMNEAAKWIVNISFD